MKRNFVEHNYWKDPQQKNVAAKINDAVWSNMVAGENSLGTKEALLV